MANRRIITDIPDSEVNFVLALLKFDGAKIKEKGVDGEGFHFVVADFPGAPPDVRLPPAGDPKRAYMDIARGELGVREVAGAGDNPRIREYFTATSLEAQPDSVPWCSAFVNWVMREAGLPRTNSAMARSWMDWGRDAGELTPGCVVVLSRGEPPQGHVGFFVGEDGPFIQVLGGNQADKVSIASFSAERVIARRLPAA